MELNTLTAISPLDGRYYSQVNALSDYFSEYAYIRTRVYIEIEYFIALCEIPLAELKNIDKNCFDTLRNIYKNFSYTQALRIKEIEKTTNHDVKAVEYYLREVFENIHLSDYKEFIHFGLTSQDINNTAIPYLMQGFHKEILLDTIIALRNKLENLSGIWKDIPMLA
ncbi:MAG: adenylosuccinate lyase, partial [Bacteroidales bacterium]|nr:adenylosuccinate lyase [Bacteroidales bacterium]